MPRVLIVDDESQVRAVLVELLALEGLEVIEAADGQAGLDMAISSAPDLVILDIKMPRLTGMDVLQELRTAAPELPVIMLTASQDLPTAVEAMRRGAFDYIAKPFDAQDLLLHVRRALRWQALQAEVDALRSEVLQTGPLGALDGPSREIQDVIQRVRQVARSSFTVVILGETGTGKELVARAIHQASPRRAKAFVAVDCGAIPETLIESELFGYERGAFTGADRRKEGHFQQAEGGTLFLDEMVNLPLVTQTKLLRALQERQLRPLGSTAAVPVDVRIVVASNRPLEAEILAGRFRQDLYYRLNEFRITIPPLRARHGDLLPLARRFMVEASMELKRSVPEISDEAAAVLLKHSWPGNVRELRSAVRRAVLVSGDTVRPEHLDLQVGGVAGPPASGDALPVSLPALREARERGAAEAERKAIRWALEIARGNKSEAARLLKTDYKNLHVKIKQYAIRPDFLSS